MIGALAPSPPLTLEEEVAREKVAPGGIRVEQANASRRRILSAGRELFADQGYDGTSVAEIAMRAGVPKGLVFHYYRSKIQLLIATIEDASAASQIAHLKIAPVKGDAQATLMRIADAFGRSPGGSADVRRIILREASAHPEVRHAMAALHHAAVDAVRHAIDVALGDGSGVSPHRRHAAAEALVAAGLHDANLRQAAGIGTDLVAIAGIIAAGLTAPGGWTLSAPEEHSKR